MKILIATLFLIVINFVTQYPEKKDMIVDDFSSYENFFPLATLDLRSKGIKDKIHIIFVSFNYIGSPIDLNFPSNEDMDHFTFKIEENGLYRPTFKKEAMRIHNSHLPYFEQTKEKYLTFKSEKFQVQKILEMSETPNWLQDDATPINSQGKKFVFICQFEAYNFSIDDTWVYVFYDETDRQVKYVHQRT